MEEFANKRMSYLNTFDKKLSASTNVQQSTFQDLEKKKLEIVHKINQLTTLKVGDMKLTTDNIRRNVDTSV